MTRHLLPWKVLSSPHELKVSCIEDSEVSALWTNLTVTFSERDSIPGDIINMSALPEAKLAREAELSYVIIATSTDYDAWRPSEGAVDVAEVMKSLAANVSNSHKVLAALLEPVNEAVQDGSKAFKAVDGSMKFSVMTKSQLIPTAAKDSLRFVLPWFPH